MVTDYTVRIPLSDRELVKGYLILTLGDSFRFAYDFQRQEQEAT